MKSNFIHGIHQPNAARSVTISGLFGDGTAKKALAEISSLIKQSPDPVTIYIKSSHGGLINAFNRIASFSATNSNSGRQCQLVTVLQGVAKSAAAFMVVSGDSAFMEIQAKIIFHGISCANYSKGMTLTGENAMPLAIRLDRENRALALKLSSTIWPRLIRLSLLLHFQGDEPPIKARARSALSLGRFADRMAARLEAQACQKLIQSAAEYAEAMAAFGKFHHSKNDQMQRSDIGRLGDFLKDNLARWSESDSIIDEFALAEIGSDYFFFREIAKEDTNARFLEYSRKFGQNFLSPDESREYLQIHSADSSRAEGLLREKLSPMLRQLRYLAIALSSQLLIGETSVSASDAYWLGLIDEVLPPLSNDQALLAKNQSVSEVAPAFTGQGNAANPQRPLDCENEFEKLV